MKTQVIANNVMVENVKVSNARVATGRASERDSMTISGMLEKLVFENAVIRFFAILFSAIMEEEITTRQTFHLIHAQLAFALLVTLGGVSLVGTLLLLVWFVLSVVSCKRSFS